MQGISFQPTDMEIREEMIQRINEVRRKHGVPELTVNQALMDAAQECSAYLYTKHNNRLECETVAEFGYPHGFGSNLTVFTITAPERIPEKAVANWENSPGHLATMIDTNYDADGVGVTIDNSKAFCYMFAGNSTAHNPYECFFVFQGCPDSGKSILAKFIRGCVNPDACTALDIGTLGERFVAANLVGKQLCLSMDIPSAPLNSRTVSVFKTMTGGDPITADVKYSPHITFFNHARFILGTNHPLLIQGEDPAFFKRAVAIPFLHSVPPEKQDPDLLERLNEERAAIVFDAVQAYRRLCERNYEFSGSYPINGMFQSSASIPQSVEAMILDFIQNHCVIAPGSMAFVEDLYKRFCAVYPVSGVEGKQFGGKVLAACHTLGFLNVHRGTKRRKEGCANPQANLVGLAIKEE